MRARRRIVCLGFVILCGLIAESFSQQLTPVVNNDAQIGVEIVSVGGDYSRDRVVNGTCVVKNDTVKEVAGLVIVWEISNKNGKAIRLFSVVDTTYSANAGRIKAGDTREIRSTSRAQTTTGGVIQRIDLSVDYVLFSDGTHVGPDITKQGRLMTERQKGANNLRHYLQIQMKKSGIEAVLKEIVPN